MAALTHSGEVAVEEYLDSSYRPETEFVDGELVNRGMQTIAHSLLQMLLIQHFRTHQTALRFVTLPEVRTSIIEGARYRVPDVAICGLPLPEGQVLTTVPWVILEILSPDDKLSEQIARFRESKRSAYCTSFCWIPRSRSPTASRTVRCSGPGSQSWTCPPVRFRSIRKTCSGS